MRALLAILGLALLVVVVLIATNTIRLTTSSGSLPSVHVDGGSAPQVKAELPRIDVGTTNRTITLPTVHVSEPAGNTAAN